MRIIIVGSDSFIARKFIERYYSEVDFRCFTRLKIRDNEIIKQDFFDIDTRELEGFDVVINFAAIVHRPDIKDESIYKKVNYSLPLELAQKAKKAGIKHFIQLSTIAVYGESEEITKNSPVNPVNFYGKYKLLADNDLLKLESENFFVTCLRPSMIYGGGNAPGNMIQLIRLVKKGFPLPFKNISAKRTFLNINNLVQAIHGIIISKLNGVILLADEKGYSTSELVSIINAGLKKKDRQFSCSLCWWLLKKVKPEIVIKLTSELSVRNTYSFKELGVDKKYNLEEGIKEMINTLN